MSLSISKYVADVRLHIFVGWWAILLMWTLNQVLVCFTFMMSVMTVENTDMQHC